MCDGPNINAPSRNLGSCDECGSTRETVIIVQSWTLPVEYLGDIQRAAFYGIDVFLFLCFVLDYVFTLVPVESLTSSHSCNKQISDIAG